MTNQVHGEGQSVDINALNLCNFHDAFPLLSFPLPCKLKKSYRNCKSDAPKLIAHAFKSNFILEV